MAPASELLTSLALVLCVAAITTVVFQRLRQPVVFGYLLAGMIVGPHIPVPVEAHAETVETLAELGVILLLFGLGLEFSLRKLLAVLPTAGPIALFQCAAMVWLGYEVGQAFGWTPLESVYAGAAIAISSTTIIVKALAEQKAAGRFTQIVYGVLIVEDLIAILLLAVLTTVSAGGEPTLGALAGTAGRLAAFLGALVFIGLLVVPRLVRMVVRLGWPDTIVLTAMGICFGAALLALEFGYSVALGAFIGGSLVAESGEAGRVERLIHPARDMFGATFFVSVGMLIDPALVVAHWQSVLVLTAAVIVGKVLTVSIGSFLVGNGVRTSVQAGMTLAQIGEFSFIIAGLGLATGATRNFLYPVAVAVSAITTLTTPWLIRRASPAASLIDRTLPRRAQTLAALYGSWIERIRRASGGLTERIRVRRLAAWILADAVLLTGITLGFVAERERAAAAVTAWSGVGAAFAKGIAAVAAIMAASPFALGLYRSVRALGVTLALAALPARGDRRGDLAAAPRRALIVTLQLAIVCVVGSPLLAVAQPFLPPIWAPVTVAAIVAIIVGVLWRRAGDLHAHARAGAQAIVTLLQRQMALPAEDTELAVLAEATDVLPGLGEPVLVRLRPGDYAVGRNLGGLDLRSVTGATVLSIARQDEDLPLQVGGDRLRAGDALVVAGTPEAINAARGLLQAGAEQPGSLRERPPRHS